MKIQYKNARKVLDAIKGSTNLLLFHHCYLDRRAAFSQIWKNLRDRGHVGGSVVKHRLGRKRG